MQMYLAQWVSDFQSSSKLRRSIVGFRAHLHFVCSNSHGFLGKSHLGNLQKKCLADHDDHGSLSLSMMIQEWNKLRMLKPAMNKACVYFLILQHTDNSTWIILIYQTWPRPPFFLPWHVVALLDGVETPNTKLGVALEDHRPTYSTRSRDIQFLGPGVTLEQHEFRYRERSEEISMGGFRGKKCQSENMKKHILYDTLLTSYQTMHEYLSSP